MKYYFFAAIFMLIAFIQPRQSFAQEATASNNVKSWIDNQQFVFVAQTVTPTGGSLRQLTSEYDLKISKDKIVSYLPYFGRAYSAPLDPRSAGFEFTSTDFTYTATPKKKGAWDVLIKFKDAADAQQMQLSVFDNGNASLQVISNNRQPIIYNGYVTEAKK